MISTLVRLGYTVSLLACLCYVLIFPAYAQVANPISVFIDNTSMSVDSTIVVHVKTSNLDAEDIFAYHLLLKYDTTLVRVQEVVISGTLSDGGLLVTHDDSEGRQIALAHNQKLRGEGTLLSFKITSQGLEGNALLQIKGFTFNEGFPEVVSSDGLLTIVRETAVDPVGADTVVVKLQGSDVHTDEMFDVPIVIENVNSAITSADFAIAYDAEYMVPVGHNLDSTMLADGLSLVNTHIQPAGRLIGSVVALTQIQEDGTLLNLHFKSLQKSGESPVEIEAFVLNEGLSPVTYKHAAIRIREPFLWGDVDEDIAVTMGDVFAIIKHVTKESPLLVHVLPAADVSGNGSVTSFDAALVLQYAIGLIQCFPVEVDCHTSEKEAAVSGVISWGVNLHQLPGHLTIPLQIKAPSSAVRAIDVEIPVGSIVTEDLYIHNRLPGEWMLHHYVQAGRLHISMVGSEPLPEGDLLLLEVSDTQHAAPLLGQAEYSLNGALPHKLPVAPEHVSSDKLDWGMAYPNPFTTSTTIRVELDMPEQVSIQVFDLLGRHIQTLVDTEMVAGRHDVRFHMPGLATGVYFYTITSGAYTKTRRLIKQ